MERKGPSLSFPFDPPHWIVIHEGEDSSAEIGIRMITRMAKDIRYYNAYNSNNLMLHVET